jgi:hypothetical protein
VFDGVLRSFSVVRIGWFATSRIVKLGKATKEESAKNVSGKSGAGLTLQSLPLYRDVSRDLLRLSRNWRSIVGTKTRNLYRMRIAKLCLSGPLLCQWFDALASRPNRISGKRSAGILIRQCARGVGHSTTSRPNLTSLEGIFNTTDDDLMQPLSPIMVTDSQLSF